MINITKEKDYYCNQMFKALKPFNTNDENSRKTALLAEKQITGLKFVQRKVNSNIPVLYLIK